MSKRTMYDDYKDKPCLWVTCENHGRFGHCIASGCNRPSPYRDEPRIKYEVKTTSLDDRSCHNCIHRFDLWRWDYSKSDVPKDLMDGFVCDLFAESGNLLWHVGRGENGQCECWERGDADGRRK